jgi:RimJ/RimL family protein N-acetyltransferase
MDTVIGFSGVKYVPEIGGTELGYRFLPEYWGRGLATEAGEASIEFARNLATPGSAAGVP